MIAIAIVGSVIAALDVLSHSEVIGMLDHEVAMGVKKTHHGLKAFHAKLHHKQNKKEEDHGIQA